jgi:hypothetical protein
MKAASRSHPIPTNPSAQRREQGFATARFASAVQLFLEREGAFRDPFLEISIQECKLLGLAIEFDENLYLSRAAPPESPEPAHSPPRPFRSRVAGRRQSADGRNEDDRGLAEAWDARGSLPPVRTRPYPACKTSTRTTATSFLSRCSNASRALFAEIRFSPRSRRIAS